MHGTWVLRNNSWTRMEWRTTKRPGWDAMLQLDCSVMTSINQRQLKCHVWCHCVSVMSQSCWHLYSTTGVHNIVETTTLCWHRKRWLVLQRCGGSNGHRNMRWSHGVQDGAQAGEECEQESKTLASQVPNSNRAQKSLEDNRQNAVTSYKCLMDAK